MEKSGPKAKKTRAQHSTLP